LILRYANKFIYDLFTYTFIRNTFEHALF